SARPERGGLSAEPPISPEIIPSSSMVSEMIPLASPSAMRRSTAPCGGGGAAIGLIFSAAMRQVNRFAPVTAYMLPLVPLGGNAHSISIAGGEKGAGAG